MSIISICFLHSQGMEYGDSGLFYYTCNVAGTYIPFNNIQKPCFVKLFDNAGAPKTLYQDKKS